jgi:carbonic anhydrase
MSVAEQMLHAAAARQEQLAHPRLSSEPRLRVAVLACMDARIDVFALLGLQPGDAHVIRNAGGLVTDDAIRSLSASQRLLGTREVVVVMHEGCGLQGASDEQFAQQLASDGAEPAWQLGSFTDLDAALRAGLERLRSSPELPARDQISGLVFDPASGALRAVVLPPAENGAGAGGENGGDGSPDVSPRRAS